MAARLQIRTPVQTPELSLSDSEDSYSSDDEEMPDREETDRLLRQAHHYVITEGGADSPSTFVERIQRINRNLIQEISMHSYDCDPKLYRRVKQKVDHVLREFEDAVDVDPSVYNCEQIPTFYSAATAGGSLYRTGSSPVTPVSSTARLNATRSSGDELQKTYLYGGPDNHPEVWYKDASASSLFPETIRLAEWESLRIRWDLATTGDTERTNPVTSNDVSFNDTRLKHHDQLDRYESGTKFKLPVSDTEDMATVNKICTVARLHKAVDAFSQHDDSRREDGEYKYAPRIFLERLDVCQRANLAEHPSPKAGDIDETPADMVTIVSDVRKALNTTPTKSSHPSASISGQSMSGKAESEPFEGSTASTPLSVSNSGHPSTPVLKPSTRSDHGVSSAIRRIKAATEASILSSSLPQSPPATSRTTQLPSAKEPRGHTSRELLAANIHPNTATQQTTATRKRKRLDVKVVEENTDVNVEAEKMSIKRARTTTEFAGPCTPIEISQSQTLSPPVATPALTMGSVSASSVASTPPVGKARAAGKKQRRIRTKSDFEERVTPEKYAKIMFERKKSITQSYESFARGVTRSGKLRAM